MGIKYQKHLESAESLLNRFEYSQIRSMQASTNIKTQAGDPLLWIVELRTHLLNLAVVTYESRQVTMLDTYLPGNNYDKDYFEQFVLGTMPRANVVVNMLQTINFLNIANGEKQFSEYLQAHAASQSTAMSILNFIMGHGSERFIQ